MGRVSLSRSLRVGLVGLMAAAVLPGHSAPEGRAARAVVDDLEPGKLLVADRAMRDPNFRQTVVLIVEYDRRTGALGLVINRPSEVELGSVMPGLEGTPGRLAEQVFVGGPVEPTHFTLLIRSKSAPELSDRVFADVYRSSSQELLERLVSTPAADETFRAYAGYAGWAPGQLEAELAIGGWHVVDGRPAIVFEHPIEKIWPRLILIGTAELARLPASERRMPPERALRGSTRTGSSTATTLRLSLRELTLLAEGSNG